jgi:transposase-like protein
MTDLTLPIYNDPEKAREHMENVRWPNGPVCPHCGAPAEGVHKLEGQKKTFRDGLYYCRQCREQFTVTVGTVCEHSHIPLHKWVLAFHLMGASKKGISALQLQRMLGLGSYRSAWFMAHRIREAMREIEPGPLGGEGKVVEADETFHGPQTYQLNAKKGWRSKRGVYAKRDKIVSLVERGGKARSIKVENISIATLREVALKNINQLSILNTDEGWSKPQIGAYFADHQRVNHSKKEYARGSTTTNTVEGFFSIFKRGMIGTYQHCGEQHLHRYLAEFDFRYNNRVALGVNDDQRAIAALKGAEGKRLTYRRSHKEASKEPENVWKNVRNPLDPR